MLGLLFSIYLLFTLNPLLRNQLVKELDINSTAKLQDLMWVNNKSITRLNTSNNII